MTLAHETDRDAEETGDGSQVSLTDHLRKLQGAGPGKVSLGDMVAQIDGGAGPGPILLILTLPVMMPLPPGVSMILAIPILIVAPQIALHRRKLWLPDWLSRREIKRDLLAKLIERILPWIARAEHVVRPRLTFLANRAGAALVGVACTLIAIILILPIPFANLLPSWSLASFSMGLTRKDGLFVLLGYALLTAALAVIAAAAFGVDFGVTRIRAMF